MINFLLMFLIFWIWQNFPIMYAHRSISHKHFTFHPIIVSLIKVIKWSRSFKYCAGWERIWAAAHLKHHVLRFTDTEKDPHTPTRHSLWFMIYKQRDWLTVEDIEYYTKSYTFTESKLDKILERCSIGPYLLLIIFLFLFSSAGFILWLACLSTHYLPGLFNYMSHTLPGYINTEPRANDQSRNLPVFLGLIFGGEELHGNHHRWANRSNYAVRWWEVDTGYLLLKLLSYVGLVKFNNSTKPLDRNTELTVRRM